MSPSARSQTEIANIRYDLAALNVEIKIIRAMRAMSRKYQSDQPRAPAGQSDGGQWVSSDTSGGSFSGSEATRQEAVTDDGTQVLSIRIRSNPSRGWDEQHTVVAPNGARTIFETSGLTQTIRDGDTGEIIAKSTMTRAGAEPEAFAQSARGGPLRSLQQGAARAFEAAASLFAVQSSRNDRSGTAVFAAPASEYMPGADGKGQAIWVGRLDQAALDSACPRNGEVQAVLNAAAASVGSTGNYMSPQDFGNKVHVVSAAYFRNLHDPNLIPEVSFIANGEPDIPYGARGSIRLDVLEKSAPLTVCVYDHKTGESGLRPRRATDIVTMTQRNFPGAQRIILIEVRPRP